MNYDKLPSKCVRRRLAPALGNDLRLFSPLSAQKYRKVKGSMSCFARQEAHRGPGELLMTCQSRMAFAKSSSKMVICFLREKKQFLENSTCWISLIAATSKGVKYPKRNSSSKKNMFYIHIIIRIYIESCACQVSTTSDNQPKHYLVLFYCNMGQHKARFLWSPWPPQRCQASSTLSLAAHPPTLEVWPVCHDRDVDPRKCCQLAMLIPVTWPTKLQLLRLPDYLPKKINRTLRLFSNLSQRGNEMKRLPKAKGIATGKKNSHHNLEASGHLLITFVKLFPLQTAR